MYYGYFDPINAVFHILGFVLIVWLVVWIIRRASGHGRFYRMNHMHNVWCDGTNCNHPSHSNSALNILKERYVKGEISKEEYEEKKKTLMN